MRTLLLLGIFVFTISKAQNFSKNYKPLRDKEPGSLYIDSIYKKFPIFDSEIKESDRSLRQSIIEMNKESRDYYKELTNEHLVYTKDSVTFYLQQILNKLISKNPAYNFGHVVVNTYRTDVPNASDFGNGLILFNLNLLPFLKNENELAFILGHELGHDYLQHVLKGQKKRHDILTNKEFKSKLSKAQNEEYNSVAKVEALYYSYLSKYFKNSRINELEADSISLIFLNNAGFNVEAGKGALVALDSIDFYHMNFKVDYKTFFNFHSLPFKPSWLEFDDGSTFPTNNSRDTIPDSLKSHPDCKQRIAVADRMLRANNYNTSATVTSVNFETVRERAMFELIEYFILREEYSRGLYYTIHLLDSYPNNEYLKISTGMFLAELQRSLINHRFTTVVDKENNYYSDSYNFFIKFLHNLTSNSYKEIAYNYMKDHLSKLQSSEYLDYCYTIYDTNNKTLSDKTGSLNKFGELYKNSYYYTLLKQKLQK